MDTETGALSVEDAVARLETEEAVEDQPQIETVEPAEDDAPETVSDEDGESDAETEEAEPEAEDDPAPPAIEPPKSWDAAHKEKWSALPPDVQEYLSTREAERDRGVAASQQKASEARQRAEAEAQVVVALKPQLEALADQARSQMDRWGQMDATAWQNLANTDPNRYVALKAQHDADVQRIQQLDAARKQAEVVEYNAFQQAQTARLPEIAPHLAERQAQAEVFDYISKAIPNITQDQMRWTSADEFLIAWKAMQYDKAQAPQPKPQGKKAPVQVKPGTPPTPMKQRQRSSREVAFQKAPTMANAMALLNGD